MFSLDLTRQFDIIDAAGEHAHYVQVHCVISYMPTPALRSLGSFEAWFFHDAGDDLAPWAAIRESRPMWALLRELGPSSVDVHEEQV
ncbi:hypothetical protein GCM10009837_74380 [Streptomyces durmitorensis]|uniref:Uncharacterized protein n=1 Tax=Streptomyces durmitorensis TaxID=319947 RepID=A0ABY4PJL2_9ACTN|nr:hypothetical protein [Streptomyces durmitorensis]UQT53837.1 hypothetical protein M4V62_01400 [Streptomyces durmitorensis]